MPRWILAILLLLIAGGALALRLPKLENRPFHNDEAVHCDKFYDLWQEGKYTYDAIDCHGPTLNYATWPIAWLMRDQIHSYADMPDRMFRLTTVIFGVGLILLLWLVKDGLGGAGTVCAAILTAISTAMVFYSRYYIQEMLLAFFAFLAIAAGWRFTRASGSGARIFWAIVCGLGIGLMHATKETWVLSGAAAGAAVLITWVWTRIVDGRWPRLAWLWSGSSLVGMLLGLLIAAGVAATLLSNFYQDWNAPVASIKTYWEVYLQRGAGGGDHDNPWDYYLRRLIFSRYGRGPVWTEGLIVGLALMGFVAALWPRARRAQPAAEQPRRMPGEPAPASDARRDGEANEHLFIRFVALYTLILTAGYSAISYKTAWCMLTFLHGMILLAGAAAGKMVGGDSAKATRALSAATITVLVYGLGAFGISRFVPDDTSREALWLYQGGLVFVVSGLAAAVTALPVALLRVIMAIILAVPAAQLAWQAHRTSFKLYAYPYNPYIVSQPHGDALRLVQRVRDLAAASESGRNMPFIATTREIQPVPYYLRDMKKFGCFPSLDAAVAFMNEHQLGSLDALVIIADPIDHLRLEGGERNGKTYEPLLRNKYIIEHYGLRPGVVRRVYVNEELWEKYLKSKGLK